MKILDFTLDLTGAGTTVGAITYMSLEQARGIGSLTTQSEQFSFGLVLTNSAPASAPSCFGSAAEPLPRNCPLRLCAG